MLSQDIQGKQLNLDLIRIFQTFQGFSTSKLTPMEVLAALQHAQSRLQREFTKEEFAEGSVGQLMIPADFDFDSNVSN